MLLTPWYAVKKMGVAVNCPGHNHTQQPQTSKA